MKKCLVMAAIMAAALSVSAQDYNWAVGIRGGVFSGLTAKKTIDNNAIEAGLSIGSGHINIDGVYQWTEPVIADGFHLYYGAGAYVGVANSYFGLGAEAVLGLEYRIPISFPLAVSIDYRPAINVIPAIDFNFINFGLGIKYCF